MVKWIIIGLMLLTDIMLTIVVIADIKERLLDKHVDTM